MFGVESASGTFTIQVSTPWVFVEYAKFTNISQTVFQQLITSLLQVGLILASLIIGPFSSRFGRRAGFVVASAVAFVGITIQVVVTTQWPLYIGRLLMGTLISEILVSEGTNTSLKNHRYCQRHLREYDGSVH